MLALNAGGSSAAASSFYLPLDRVTRALQLIQDGKPVARGTLQTVFVYTPFDEVRRLGLRNETETDVRRKFPNNTGMLVVSEVQRGSPAEQTARAGRHPGAHQRRADAPISIALADVLDDGVGKTVKLDDRARRRRRFERELAIQDLYAVTPDQLPRVRRRASCTTCRGSRRATSTCRSAACTSPIPVTCSARPACRAAP